MTELDKAKFILKYLSQSEIKLNGAKEAYSFTQSYTWLIELAKEMEQKEQNGRNNGRQSRKSS